MSEPPKRDVAVWVAVIALVVLVIVWAGGASMMGSWTMPNMGPWMWPGAQGARGGGLPLPLACSCWSALQPWPHAHCRARLMTARTMMGRCDWRGSGMREGRSRGNSSRKFAPIWNGPHRREQIRMTAGHNVIRIMGSITGGLIFVAAVASGNPANTYGAEATPTPYHEGIPGGIATPHAMAPSLYPLPSPEDRASAEAMAAGAAAMVRMAQVMDEAATLMRDSDNPELIDLGRHWALDAQALRQQAAWMVLSATAADMIHDPATAHEINARNLKGNGLAMSSEGQAMAEHGQAMATRVAQLREAGALSPAVADELVAAADELIATGTSLERDGQRMQDSADLMLKLIGQ